MDSATELSYRRVKIIVLLLFIGGIVDWQKGNRFDRLVLELFRNESRQFTVRAVVAGEAGSLAIGLEDGYQLEIFPHDSDSDEHWRFFKPHTEELHFVVFGKTLQRE